jgi:hypothetical protein
MSAHLARHYTIAARRAPSIRPPRPRRRGDTGTPALRRTDTQRFDARMRSQRDRAPTDIDVVLLETHLRELCIAAPPCQHAGRQAGSAAERPRRAPAAPWRRGPAAAQRGYPWASAPRRDPAAGRGPTCPVRWVALAGPALVGPPVPLADEPCGCAAGGGGDAGGAGCGRRMLRMNFTATMESRKPLLDRLPGNMVCVRMHGISAGVAQRGHDGDLDELEVGEEAYGVGGHDHENEHGHVLVRARVARPAALRRAGLLRQRAPQLRGGDRWLEHEEASAGCGG